MTSLTGHGVRTRLAELDRVLGPVSPAGAFAPAKRVGDIVYTSGQVPMVDGALLATGQVGAEIGLAAARECAEVCVLNAIAAVLSVLEDSDEIATVVRVMGYVASADGFNDQSLVLNAASELVVAVFGDAGAHVRSAVGVRELPMDAPVEVELIVELV
jgi:enamine deaminase RidA (YjgF/YER057c/UK114 family)